MSSGYNPETDGSFAGWWARWMALGFLIAIGFGCWLMHEANLRMEENLPSKRQGTTQVTTPSRP